MKKLLTSSLVLLMFILSADYIHAQEKNTDRKTRKEIRRQERAIKDSLLSVMKGSEGDSVNVGYGYTRKKDLNSSVSRLKGSRRSIESYSDIADYIQGNVPGVMVQKNGGSVRYIIRGIGTNSDFTDPLLMVDGIEVDNFNSVLPHLVESVEVIKDGSSSIYGMRGANGVIMITTKKE